MEQEKKEQNQMGQSEYSLENIQSTDKIEWNAAIQFELYVESIGDEQFRKKFSESTEENKFNIALHFNAVLQCQNERNIQKMIDWQ